MSKVESLKSAEVMGQGPGGVRIRRSDWAAAASCRCGRVFCGPIDLSNAGFGFNWQDEIRRLEPMRIGHWTRSILAMCLGTLLAMAADQKVEVAPGLTGAWNRPVSGWDGRTVLLFHGMAQDMDEVGDLHKKLAARLSERGIASLRVNFRGEGDRARTNIESTFTSRLADAVSARTFVVRQEGVRSDRIGVVGFSLGSATAIETGGRHPEWFRTLVLWSSPSGKILDYLLTRPDAQAAMRDGVGCDNVPGWKPVYTKREFYESFRGVDLDQSLARFPGPVLSIRGSEDFLPRRDVEMLNAAPGRPREAVLLGGADHIFRVFQPELGYEPRVLDLTESWLVKHL